MATSEPEETNDQLRREIEALKREVDRIRTEHAAAWRLADRVRRLIPYTVYIYDIERQRVLWLTEHLGRSLGYSEAEVSAMKDGVLDTLLHPDDLARLPELLTRWKDVADEAVLEVEYRMRTRDGHWRWMLGQDVVFERDASGAVTKLIGTCLDITDLKLLQSRLAETEKLEALGRLAGGVAHDFNNLLTVILGEAEIALAQSEAGTGPGRALRSVLKAGAEAAELTRRLMTFARAPESGSRHERIDLNAFLCDLDPVLRGLAGRGVQLELRLSPEVDPVELERSQLTQVVVNLTTNARDAMPGGGRIVISTEPASPHEASRAEGVWLRVSDSGEGMTSEVRARVFEPFFTTRPAGRGTGLGLATVSRIVHELGGCIDLETAPGEGACFSIWLPCCAAST